MNYEALGRYTEAMENLPKLTNEMQNCLRTLENQARDANGEINRLQGLSNNPEPVRLSHTLQTLETALARIQVLHQEIIAHAHIINTQAKECGRKGVNIRHD